MKSKRNIKKALLQCLSRRNYRPMTSKQLLKKLKISGSQHFLFFEELQLLEQEQRISRHKGKKWILSSDTEVKESSGADNRKREGRTKRESRRDKKEQNDRITGKLQFNEKGFAFLIPDEGGDDYYVREEDTGVALHMDWVAVEAIKNSSHFLNRRIGRRSKSTSRLKNKEDKKRAKVVEVLQRNSSTLVGTLEKQGKRFEVIPDESRIGSIIKVPDPKKSSIQALPGDKVVVKLLEWKSREEPLEGKVIEKLGKEGDPGVDILAIIKKHNLRTVFSDKIKKEVQQYKDPYGDAKDDTKGSRRLDLREELIITIDPETAKDFDDAIHVKPLRKGVWEVGVHIADVSHYVQPGSALDREARKRGNSVYLVNQVVPMLPESLSNGLCSLIPQVDRLTHSVIATVNEKGILLDSKIVKTIIHSQKRFSYEEAFERMQRKKSMDKFDRLLKDAWKVASGLRRKRMREGALDLEMPDVKIKCDDKGNPVALERVEYDESHQLIEEFMLMANEVVATQLKNRNRATVYRVHEAPDPEKLNEYRESLLASGIKVGDLNNRSEIQKALRQIEKKPEAHALKIGLLKSMKRAQYQTKQIGHYGLSKTNYTHFTSPIRRYADLVVHRSLSKLEKGKKILGVQKLNEIAKHLCEVERKAAEAEQETVTLKKFEFFESQLEADQPRSFDALIVEVQSFGLFVELPDFLVSGLVHASMLRDDYYLYNERKKTMEGRRGKQVFAIGERVRVRVEKMDKSKRQIDFSLV